MVALTGTLCDNPILQSSSGLNPSIDPHALVSIGLFLAGSGNAGTFADTQPVNENPVALNGAAANNFGFNDYFDRIHFSTIAIDLGNVIADQTYQISVWNAYQVSRTLNAVTPSNATGLTLTQPFTPPGTIKGMQEVTYSLLVTTTGPANIDASYLFDFDSVDVTVTVTGSRITAWLWGPDGGLLERLEWLTDVMPAYNGNEQRMQIRTTPRRSFEYDFAAIGADRRRAENVLYSWGARVFAVPVWFDGETLEASVSAGALSIPCSAQYRDYHVGGLAMLMKDATSYEVVEIGAVGVSSITIARALQATWPAGTKIYPLRLARMPDSVGVRRFNGDTSYGRVRFVCTDINTYTAATETTYRGYPVLTDKPNWSEDLSDEWQRKTQWFDSPSAGYFVDDESGLPTHRQGQRWTLTSRAQIDTYRQWLYARKGRLTSFWLPTWAADIVVLTDFGTSTTVFDIEHQGYTKQVNEGIGRRDIRIETVAGVIYYRRILSASELNSTTERLTIDSALGVSLTAANIRSVSFMALARLEADAVEIGWWKYDVAESTLQVRTVTNDL